MHSTRPVAPKASSAQLRFAWHAGRRVCGSMSRLEDFPAPASLVGRVHAALQALAIVRAAVDISMMFEVVASAVTAIVSVLLEFIGRAMQPQGRHIVGGHQPAHHRR